MKAIHKPFRLVLLAVLLIGIFAVGCAAADESPLPELLPDSVTGAYNYTYAEGEPHASYLVFMLAGTYTESDTPTLSAADGNVLYYNHVRADENGNVLLSFVPMSYKDGTVFLSSAASKKPLALCYAKAGDAKDLADFSLTLDAEEYTLKGGNEPTYVRYTVKAVDSFGFAAKLPSFAKRTIVGYEGDAIEILASGNAIALRPSLEEGVYTFSIACGDIVRTADIKVKHASSVPTSMEVTVDGTAYSSYYIVAKTDTDTTVFDPESLHIEAKTFDQYGNVIEDSYTYSYVQIYGTVVGKPQQLVGNASVMEFYPPDVPGLSEDLQYTLTVASSYTDPKSSRKQPFSKSFDITVKGGSAYTGTAEKLFATYLKAKVDIDKLDNGDILIADSSVNVPQDKMWCTQASADKFRAAFNEAEALLIKHKTEPQSDDRLSSQDTALTRAITQFKTYSGSYAVIQNITFKNPTQVLPLGDSQTFTATCTPARPSEKVLYTSDNEEVATVDASGTVKALGGGMAVITASNTDGTITASYELTVYRPITSISFEQSKLTLVSGETMALAYKAEPADHGDTLTFTSDNPKVVRVDAENGTLLALSEGSTTIRVTTSGKPKAEMTVNVVVPNFTGTSGIRLKRQSEFALTYTLGNACHFSKMRMTATYDPAVFTLKNAACTAYEDSFLGTDTQTAGKAVSSWKFETPLQASSLSELLAYTFTVNEEAAFGKYPITVVLEAQTENGSSILINNFEWKTETTVGETSTYTVKTEVSGSGTVSEGGAYEYGESVTLVATPNSNYTLSGWYVGNRLVYTGLQYTFTVTEDVTVVAKFAKKTPSGGGGGGGGGGGSTGGGSTGGVTKLEQVKPVFCDTPSGEIKPGTKVTLRCSTVGAVIYYTLDGTTPTGASLRYEAPIEITQNGTQIRAVAIRNGMTNSEISAFNFRFPVEETKDPEPTPDKDPDPNAGIALKANAAQIKYLIPTSSYIRPNDPASRYEVVDMLDKLFDITGTTAGNRFADVSEAHKQAVELFAAAGVINGYEDGSFGGAREITRAEMVKILSVLLGLDKTAVEGETAVTLSDISGHWAESYIRKFVAKGYILGYPEGDFRPDKAVSRAEAVTIINRVTGLAKTSGLPQRFRDLPGDFWAYDEIMNAVTDEASPNA